MGHEEPSLGLSNFPKNGDPLQLKPVYPRFDASINEAVFKLQIRKRGFGYLQIALDEGVVFIINLKYFPNQKRMMLHCGAHLKNKSSAILYDLGIYREASTLKKIGGFRCNGARYKYENGRYYTSGAPVMVGFTRILNECRNPKAIVIKIKIPFIPKD